MYDEAIAALRNNQPEQAVMWIVRALEEQARPVPPPVEQLPLPYRSTTDFIPKHGWEAA